MMKWVFILGLWLLPFWAMGFNDTVVINSQGLTLLKGKKIGIFQDRSNKMSFEEVRTVEGFSSPLQSIPNLGISNATVWLRFTVFNQTANQELLVNLKNPRLNYVTLYYPSDRNGNYRFLRGGNQVPLSEHGFNNQNNIFRFPIPPSSTRTLYVKIKSYGQIVAPMFVGTKDKVSEDISRDNFIFGVYLGVILIMFFYNLFIYFTTDDIHYLYYIGYIFFVGFAQFILYGYGYLFIWDARPLINLQSINWVGALSGIATVMFLRAFLETHLKLPRLDKFLLGFVGLYLCTIILTVLGVYDISFILIDAVAFFGSFTFLGVGILLTLKGSRQAKFFLMVWSFFIISVILYVAIDFELIPYNNFTSNILLLGSSIEIALLSIVLGDKINSYKKEKEQSQAAALQSAREKEDYIRQENAVLEEEVHKRTEELQNANIDLTVALGTLKNAQSQLVGAEKMSSLGQLTAGIAHEINNPINFVQSSVKPLIMDIQDLWKLHSKYDGLDENNFREKVREIAAFKEKIDLPFLKKEIDELLTGIGEGARRTADIVRVLKNFSRLDEDTIKEMCIPEAIDTTLTLLKHSIPPNLNIIKQYNATDLVECYPGKLNQVFMNILTNAIQAMALTEGKDEERLIITTDRHDAEYLISIRDTGPGIPEEIRDRIFDPFFTTKDVGKGTGLGLSIVYNIIEKHKGEIEIHSSEGKGTEFLITLPVKQTG